MALYWPDKKVALDIVDDPKRNPFIGDESFTVFHVTLDELSDKEGYRRVKTSITEALGTKVVPEPMVEDGGEDLDHAMEAFVARLLMIEPSTNITFKKAPKEFESVEILAHDDAEAENMSRSAKEEGQKVRGVKIWDGPVPEGSFYMLSPTMRMSTPEYFYLRKTNELGLTEAVGLGLELCGKFRTSATQYDLTDTYDFLRNPRTTKAKISKYLRGASGTKEGKRAKRVLSLINENCPSPVSAWLFLMLCLPSIHGSYGLPKAEMGKVLTTDTGYLPPADGIYIVYDLTWREQWLSLQYVGPREPGMKAADEISQGKMRVILVTDDDMRDTASMDLIAAKVAAHLGCELPSHDEKWLETRTALRKQIEVPTFEKMRLTMAEMSSHIND